MPTRHVLRFTGGPLVHGSYVFEDGPDNPWPPPFRIPQAGGYYERISYSSLGPTDPDVNGVIRGAAYVWRPREVE